MDITVETTVEVPAGIVWVMVVSPKVEVTVEMMVEVPAEMVNVSIEVMMLVMV